MFGFKLVKEKDLKNLEIKLDMMQNSYRIMVEESQLNLDIAWQLRMDNAELEETICMYSEALELTTTEKKNLNRDVNRWLSKQDEIINALQKSNDKLATLLEKYRRRYGTAEIEEFAWYGS